MARKKFTKKKIMSSIGRTELSFLAQECLNDHDVII